MASVLETFFILFESDAKDVKKGALDAKKPVDDLEKSLKSSDRQTGSLTKGMVRLGAQATAAFASIFAFTSLVQQTNAIITKTDELKKFSDAIGENVGEVDAWSEAVIRAGGTSSGFQGSLKSLNEKMVDASLKGMNEIVPFFNQLGISIVDANGKARRTLDVLPELADAFQDISKQESLGIGQKLGLDQNTILLLQSGRAEVEKLIARQRSLGVVTEQQAIAVQKFVDQWSDFKQASADATRGILLEVLPALTSMLAAYETFTFFLADNEHLVTGAIIAISTAITAFALPAIIKLGSWVLLTAAPFLLLVAGIALLYDEYKTFLEGGETLFGKLLDKFPAFAEANALITKGLSKTLEIIKMIYEEFLNLIGLGDKESLFTTAFKALFSSSETVGQGQTLLSQAMSSPIGAQTSNSITNSSVNNQKPVSVDIKEVKVITQATDADGISTDIGKHLKEQIKLAVDSFDDGIEA